MAGSVERRLVGGAAEEAEARAGARLHRERDVFQHRKSRKDRRDLKAARQPARARAPRGGNAVTSLPANRMRPSSGGMMPDIWLISVVLPAPFGPMMACISPGMTSSVTSSVTTRLPKFLRRPSRRSSGIRSSSSANRRHSRRAEPDQSAAREQNDQDQNRPEDHLPVLGDARQPFLGQQIGGAAEDARRRACRRRRG